MELPKKTKWKNLLVGAFAGIALKYTYDKFLHEKCIQEKLKSIPCVFKRGPGPARVKSVYPDRQTFAYQHDSPIWIEFDMDMDGSTITRDTVIVKSSASDEPIDGLLDAGLRMLMFRPHKQYPIGATDARVTITLIGSDTGSGAITDLDGVPLDGDKDGKAGGNFEYTFNIIK